MTHLLYAYGWDLTESTENCGKCSVLLFIHDCCVGNWKEAVLTSLKAVLQHFHGKTENNHKYQSHDLT